MYLIEVGTSGCGRSRESHVMEPLILYLDLDVQLSVLLGGCRKCGYGAGHDIGHSTSIVANPRFEAMLQSMENGCGQKCGVQCFSFGLT